MHEHDDILTALVGQPNSGKSTVFNYLTGLHQTVANYPGVTVCKKSGHYHEGKRRIEVVDLPGTYSLTSYTQEERVTRDFLLLEQPEVVILVIDAANLRRHLYLAFQLRELQVPLVVCLNMMDIAQRRGFQIDVARLEEMLGVPVVPTIARCSQLGAPSCSSQCCVARGRGKTVFESPDGPPQDGQSPDGQSPDAGLAVNQSVPDFTGLEALRHQISVISQKHNHTTPADWTLHYGEIEPLIAEIDGLLSQKPRLAQDFPTRWLAIKLLENAREARRIIQHHLHEPGWEELLRTCLQKIEHYAQSNGTQSNGNDSFQKIIASKRNEYAELIEKEVIHRASRPRRRSDRADQVLCHPVAGIFCVAGILFAMFSLAFHLADGWHWFPWICEGEGRFVWQTPMGVVESIFAFWFPYWLDSLFALPDGDVRSLLYDGVIAGVGGVIVFVPIIFFIFLLVSVLEQTGYMARVVVVLDRLMRLFGLHGHSIVPMLLAGGIVGGCAVPAVMATRTMREQRERLLTIMILPLMNCGAKIPVYAILIAAFFSAYREMMLLAIILISWACAMFAALLLGKFFVKGRPSPLLIELPTYQFPLLRDVLQTAGLQTWWFLKRAGTIILAANIVLWALMYYPRPPDQNANALESSYASRMGQFFEPVSQLAGFDWRDNVALIGGFAAKEVIVSAMITMYEIEGDHDEEAVAGKPQAESNQSELESNESETSRDRLAQRLQSDEGWTPWKAFAMLLFVMLYSPCLATCVVIWRETGHIKYMLAAILYTNVLAFTLAVCVYQMGLILG